MLEDLFDHRGLFDGGDDADKKVNVADKLPSDSITYGRDLHWVLRNKARVAALREKGKKFICYFTAGTVPSRDYIEQNGLYTKPGIKLISCGKLRRW